MSRRARPAGARCAGAAALCLVLVAGVSCAGQPSAPGETLPYQVVLTPTGDPAASQAVSWWAESAPEDGQVLQIAPAGEPEAITEVDAGATPAPDGAWHSATADGLQPGTAYRYRVGAGDGWFGGWHRFTTAADAAEPFTFLYFGDVQNDIAEQAAPVIRAALAAEPGAEILVHAGDLVRDAESAADWHAWRQAFGRETLAGINQVPAVGNHEYSGELSPFWRPQFPTAGNGPTRGADLRDTVSYTDYQGVRFVTLNSNYRDATGEPRAWLAEQREWLERVLEDNPGEWTVVNFHHPVFPNGPGRDNARLREAWRQTLEEGGADLVLQGHDHSYGRGQSTGGGPVYVVAVTGPRMDPVSEDGWQDHGAELQEQRGGSQTFQTVRVDGDTLHFTARTADGDRIDEFRLEHGAGTRLVEDP